MLKTRCLLHKCIQYLYVQRHMRTIFYVLGHLIQAHSLTIRNFLHYELQCLDSFSLKIKITIIWFQAIRQKVNKEFVLAGCSFNQEFHWSYYIYLELIWNIIHEFINLIQKFLNLVFLANLQQYWNSNWGKILAFVIKHILKIFCICYKTKSHWIWN